MQNNTNNKKVTMKHEIIQQQEINNWYKLDQKSNQSLITVVSSDPLKTLDSISKPLSIDAYAC